jgi:peptide-methionine (S)-S-oxide reductase
MATTQHIAPRTSRRTFTLAAVGLAAAALTWSTVSMPAEPGIQIPAPASDTASAPGNGLETAVLAGGCFWGVQGVFQHVQGVTNAVSGYAGGSANNANYESVGSGSTGHAEAVRISFDPKKVSYGRLLQIYFSVAHNPTELNRQGPDRGTQYRSTIFPTNAEQARVARNYIEQLNRSKTFGKDLATTVEPAKEFYPAEDYHQDFLTLHPNQPYIAINDMPKIDELKRLFPTAYSAAPVLVGSAGQSKRKGAMGG